MKEQTYASPANFAAWFRSAGEREREAVFNSLPETKRKESGRPLIILSHSASHLNAFEVVASDLVNQGTVPLGTNIAGGVVIVAREQPENPEDLDLFLQVGIRAGMAEATGLMKEGRIDDAVAAARNAGVWIDGLAADRKTEPVLQSREDLRLKEAEVLCDASRYDEAQQVLASVRENVLSPPQNISYKSIKRRCEVGGVDQDGGYSVADVQALTQQLDQMKMMGGMTGLLNAEVVGRIDKLIARMRAVRTAEDITPDFGADIIETVQELKNALGI